MSSMANSYDRDGHDRMYGGALMCDNKFLRIRREPRLKLNQKTIDALFDNPLVGGLEDGKVLHFWDLFSLALKLDLGDTHKGIIKYTLYHLDADGKKETTRFTTTELKPSDAVKSHLDRRTVDHLYFWCLTGVHGDELPSYHFYAGEPNEVTLANKLFGGNRWVDERKHFLRHLDNVKGEEGKLKKKYTFHPEDPDWKREHTRISRFLEDNKDQGSFWAMDQLLEKSQETLLTPAHTYGALTKLQMRNTLQYREALKRFPDVADEFATKLTMAYFGLPVEPIKHSDFGPSFLDAFGFGAIGSPDYRDEIILDSVRNEPAPLEFLDEYDDRTYGYPWVRRAPRDLLYKAQPKAVREVFRRHAVTNAVLSPLPTVGCGKHLYSDMGVYETEDVAGVLASSGRLRGRASDDFSLRGGGYEETLRLRGGGMDVPLLHRGRATRNIFLGEEDSDEEIKHQSGQVSKNTGSKSTPKSQSARKSSNSPAKKVAFNDAPGPEGDNGSDSSSSYSSELSESSESAPNTPSPAKINTPWGPKSQGELAKTRWELEQEIQRIQDQARVDAYTKNPTVHSKPPLPAIPQHGTPNEFMLSAGNLMPKVFTNDLSISQIRKLQTDNRNLQNTILKRMEYCFVCNEGLPVGDSQKVVEAREAHFGAHRNDIDRNNHCPICLADGWETFTDTERMVHLHECLEDALGEKWSVYKCPYERCPVLFGYGTDNDDIPAIINHMFSHFLVYKQKYHPDPPQWTFDPQAIWCQDCGINLDKYKTIPELVDHTLDCPDKGPLNKPKYCMYCGKDKDIIHDFTTIEEHIKDCERKQWRITMPTSVDIYKDLDTANAIQRFADKVTTCGYLGSYNCPFSGCTANMKTSKKSEFNEHMQIHLNSNDKVRFICPFGRCGVDMASMNTKHFQKHLISHYGGLKCAHPECEHYFFDPYNKVHEPRSVERWKQHAKTHFKDLEVAPPTASTLPIKAVTWAQCAYRGCGYNFSKDPPEKHEYCEHAKTHCKHIGEPDEPIAEGACMYPDCDHLFSSNNPAIDEFERHTATHGLSRGQMRIRVRGSCMFPGCNHQFSSDNITQDEFLDHTNTHTGDGNDNVPPATQNYYLINPAAQDEGLKTIPLAWKNKLPAGYKFWCPWCYRSVQGASLTGHRTGKGYRCFCDRNEDFVVGTDEMMADAKHSRVDSQACTALETYKEYCIRALGSAAAGLIGPNNTALQLPLVRAPALGGSRGHDDDEDSGSDGSDGSDDSDDAGTSLQVRSGIKRNVSEAEFTKAQNPPPKRPKGNVTKKSPGKK